MSTYMQNAGVKLFRRHLEQYTPPDPLYEYYTDPKGKQRRKKRDVPLGLSARDIKILKAVQRRARCLDKSFNLCGLRFGWTFFIGIVPGAGDIACTTLSYVLVIRKAREADLPHWLVARMLLNTAVSALSGVVPLVGDVVAAVYKANSRNAILLEEYLRVRGVEYLKLQAEKEEEEERGRRGRAGAGDSVSQGDAEELKPGTSDKEIGRRLSSPMDQTGWQRTMQLRPERGRFIENIND